MGVSNPEMEKYLHGQFSELEGEKIESDKLKKANRELQEARSGKGEDGVFEIGEGDSPEEESESKRDAA